MEEFRGGGDNTLGMLIDTSRNGWGGPNRPNQAPDEAAISVTDFVNLARVDRRLHRDNWCNQIGAGIGERPQAAPKPFVDAYIWVKTPGFSDGTSEEFYGTSTEQVNWVADMCDPEGEKPESNASDQNGQLIPTGAMDNTPRLNRWHSEGFKSLMNNAYPLILK